MLFQMFRSFDSLILNLLFGPLILIFRSFGRDPTGLRFVKIKVNVYLLILNSSQKEEIYFNKIMFASLSLSQKKIMSSLYSIFLEKHQLFIKLICINYKQ